MKKEFLLEKVTTGNYNYVYLIGFPIFFGAFILYSEFGSKYLGTGGIILVFLAVYGLIRFLLKKMSKNIRIIFDKNHIVINGKAFDKKDIKGIYSYDYINNQQSIISIQFQFRNHKNLEITDTEYRNRYDKDKGENLKLFLKTVMKELNFTKQRKSNFRAIQNLGAYWYSNNESSN